MRDRLLFLLIGVFGCLLAGAVIGEYLANPQDTSRSTPPALASPALPGPAAAAAQPAGQVSILLLAVDNRDSAAPILDGCWVLTFTPGTNQYFLLGFPLDTPIGESRTLRDYYAAGRSLADGSRFVEEAVKIATEGGLIVQYQVILDRPAIADLTDLVGGITLNGEALSGPALIERYSALPQDDPRLEIGFQGEALGAFFESLTRQSWTADSLDQLFQHYEPYSDDADSLLVLARQALPLTNAEFHVRVFEPLP
jgi:hypothetical protein